jgi:hypothetical protein
MRVHAYLYMTGLELVYTHGLWVRVARHNVDVIECRSIRRNHLALSEASPWTALELGGRL